MNEYRIYLLCAKVKVSCSCSAAIVIRGQNPGDKHLARNHRPVPLTSMICKLLEHIIVSHTMGHLDQYKILSDRQHSFGPESSCKSKLALTVEDFLASSDVGTPEDSEMRESEILYMTFTIQFQPS